MDFKELSKQTGINIVTLQKRYKNGDRGDYLIRPLHSNRHGKKKDTKNIKVIIDNKEYSLKELSSIYSIPYTTIKHRYDLGWRENKLIQPVIEPEKRNGKLKDRTVVMVNKFNEGLDYICNALPYETYNDRYRYIFLSSEQMLLVDRLNRNFTIIYCNDKEDGRRFVKSVIDNLSENRQNDKYETKDILDKIKPNFIPVKEEKQKILLIEEGSVDTETLRILGIPFIMYQKGKKPEIIEV